MPVYLCRVADSQGRIEEIRREAASEESCLRELSAANPFVLSIRTLSPSRVDARHPRRLVDELTDLLALLLASGLSLKDALEAAQGAFGGGSGAGLARGLLARLRQGRTFAEALQAEGKLFPPFYRGMVRIGERIGTLDKVFERLSAYRKEQKGLRERLVTSLIYPAIVIAVALFSAILVVTVLLPRMKDFFAQLGPQSAMKVDALSGSLQAALVILGVVLLAGLGFTAAVFIARSTKGRVALTLDAVLLRMPLVSSFMLRRELLNFSFAMEALTGAGVSVEEALREAAGALSNRALRQEVNAARDKVLQGERLSAAFARCALFPTRVSQWLAIGERVGRVEKVFAQLRGCYQQEVEKWVARLMTLMEPAIVAGLGILIILFVVFFIVPIFSLYAGVL